MPKEPIMAIENEEETKTGIRFANDFSDELKDRIKAEAAKREEIRASVANGAGEVIQKMKECKNSN